MDYPRSSVPEGRAGDWVVDRFEIFAANGERPETRPQWAISPPGIYTRLRFGDIVFMTDQRDEWWTQRPAIDQACARGGQILLTGLGLGLVAETMLETADSKVERVVVVEASADVIALVAPYLLQRYDGRIAVEHADAFDWTPPAGDRFTVGWHDIWDNPADPSCPAEEATLLERYAPYCDWQGTWSEQWRADEAAARLAR